jgi:hypothetical protein
MQPGSPKNAVFTVITDASRCGKLPNRGFSAVEKRRNPGFSTARTPKTAFYASHQAFYAKNSSDNVRYVK